MSTYAIVKRKPQISIGSWKLWDTCLKILYGFGIILTIGTIIFLYFWGAYFSHLLVLLVPIGVSISKASSFFRTFTKAILECEELDLLAEEHSIYTLYLDLAYQLFVGGIILGLHLVPALGHAVRSNNDASLPLDWFIFILAVVLLIMAGKLESYSKFMLREKFGPPKFLLTWPDSDTMKIPIPTTPTKEPVPRKFS
jgi:hypothetical protein